MTGLNSYEKRWRTALHVTLSAFIAAILGLGITPVAHAAAVTATLTVEHNVADRFHRQLHRSPTRAWDSYPTGGSNSTCRWEKVLSHTWNSTFAQSGTHFVITPANWNRTIPPGGSATGGMRGVLSGSYSPPVELSDQRASLHLTAI